MTQSDKQSSNYNLPRPDPVGFWEAFSFWLKLGFVSFGGPARQKSRRSWAALPYVIPMLE